jgi:drug/metabolite transporter (DMT)-like permease
VALSVSVALGLLAMVSYGVAVALSPPLARRLGPARMLFGRGVAVCAVLLAGALPGLWHLDAPAAAVGTLALGVAGYLPVLAFTHGVRISRLGVVAPVAGTAPLVTVLLSAGVLGVPIAPVQWAAIGLVVAANATASADPGSGRGQDARRAGGVGLALAAAAGWGVFFFLLIKATNALGPWLAGWLVEVGVTAAAGLHLLLSAPPAPAGSDPPDAAPAGRDPAGSHPAGTAPAGSHPAGTDPPAGHLPGRHTATRSGVAANGVLLAVGTAAFTVGARYGNPGIVAVLSNSNALVATVLGTVLYQEHLTRRERACAAMLLLGVALITAG